MEPGKGGLWAIRGGPSLPAPPQPHLGLAPQGEIWQGEVGHCGQGRGHPSGPVPGALLTASEASGTGRARWWTGTWGLSPTGWALLGLGPPFLPRFSPGARQAATEGELATKAYSSGFKKVLKPVQLFFIRCSGMFSLQRLLKMQANVCLICKDLIMASTSV